VADGVVVLVCIELELVLFLCLLMGKVGVGYRTIGSAGKDKVTAESACAGSAVVKPKKMAGNNIMSVWEIILSTNGGIGGVQLVWKMVVIV
jgi:hypothetical protein